MESLEESYSYCHEVMRRAARNFYFGMRLLPPAKRRGMHALYAYMRHIDDVTDGDAGPVVGAEETRAQLERWRTATHAAVEGAETAHPLLPALADTVRRFAIPVKTLDDAIDGQLRDMRQSRYDTFAELYQYCYHVASTVGIASAYIWGFRDPAALKRTEEFGVALQLTNILRDLKEDAGRGRQYLPTEDFVRFHVDPARMDDGEGVSQLIAFEAARAESYYASSAALVDLIDPDARPTVRIMSSIYHGILRRIVANPRRVLTQRVGLSRIEKLALVARHAWLAYRMKLSRT